MRKRIILQRPLFVPSVPFLCPDPDFPDGVEDDIVGQFQGVRLLLHDDRLVDVVHLRRFRYTDRSDSYTDEEGIGKL